MGPRLALRIGPCLRGTADGAPLALPARAPCADRPERNAWTSAYPRLRNAPWQAPTGRVARLSVGSPRAARSQPLVADSVLQLVAGLSWRCAVCSPVGRQYGAIPCPRGSALARIVVALRLPCRGWRRQSRCPTSSKEFARGGLRIPFRIASVAP